MKNLKIIVSFIGLLASFSFVNAGAMEKNNKDLNQQKREMTGFKTTNGNGFFTDEHNKSIYLEFANREKKYNEYTTIAENVLEKNKNIYEKMVNKERKVYPNTFGFDLDCINTLLDEYIEALRQKECSVDYGGECTNSIIHGCFNELYDVFISSYGFSKLSLQSLSKISGNKETRLFDSVVFKLSNEGMEKGENLFTVYRTFIAERVLNQILEFFVVFLDFYKANVKKEYGLLYANNDIDNVKRQDEKVNKYIKEITLRDNFNLILPNQNIKNKDIKYKNVAFNGESGDLLKFYGITYNKIVTDKDLQKEYPIFYAISNDEYFKLFNPENIENIRLDDCNLILFTFKEDKFNESQSKLLEFMSKDIERMSSKLSVSAVKQIILIYFEFVKRNTEEMDESNLQNRLYKSYDKENIKDLEKKSEHVVKEMNLDSVNDLFFETVGEKVKPLIKGIKGVEFNGKPEDLLKFYEQAYDILRYKQVLPVNCRDRFILFIPENIKHIALDNLNAVFKFDTANIMKCCNKEEAFGNNFTKKLFYNLDHFSDMAKSDKFFIYIKQIILTYLECAKEKKEEKATEEKKEENVKVEEVKKEEEKKEEKLDEIDTTSSKNKKEENVNKEELNKEEDKKEYEKEEKATEEKKEENIKEIQEKEYEKEEKDKQYKK